jgi:hypothetical protein
MLWAVAGIELVIILDRLTNISAMVSGKVQGMFRGVN